MGMSWKKRLTVSTVAQYWPSTPSTVRSMPSAPMMPVSNGNSETTKSVAAQNANTALDNPASRKSCGKAGDTVSAVVPTAAGGSKLAALISVAVVSTHAILIATSSAGNRPSVYV